jgi:hypothetical protein
MAVRLARTVALGVIIGIGLFNLYQAVTNWTLSDAGAYWLAATRLREGEPLYPELASVDASEVYRYAPWFAWLAVPFTLLPQWLAGVLWSVILLAASAVALAPLVRMQAWVQVALFAPILVGISAVGNVQPLIIAPLMWTMERRGGPIFVALAASLKVFPLLLALVYAGRRQWGRLATAVVVTVVLWVPAPLFYDMRTYPTDPGQAGFLVTIPLLYVVAIGLGIGVTLALAPTRFGWVSGGTTVALSLPRFFVYDVTYVMLGAQSQCRTAARRSAEQRQ